MKSSKINIKDLRECHNLEGYLWLSNANKPILIYNNELPELNDDNDLPLIIEAMLYNKNEHYSISLRYLDGAYNINKYQPDGNDIFSEETYFPNKLPFKLIFRNYWIPEVDDECLGMQVLKPSLFLFTGFKN